MVESNSLTSFSAPQAKGQNQEKKTVQYLENQRDSKDAPSELFSSLCEGSLAPCRLCLDSCWLLRSSEKKGDFGAFVGKKPLRKINN